jgi:hypothetical protein
VSRIIFNQPPSVRRVLDALDAWHRRDDDGLTPEAAHKVVAVMEAAICAIRMDVLPACWQGQRHHAAACFNYVDEVRQHPSFRGHNNPPQIDINFRRKRP